MRIYVFTAVDLEQQLIKHYSTKSATALAWDQSGFGANDPGRERDTTKLKSEHFDLLYPIDIDVGLNTSSIVGKFSVAEVLSKLKTEVPYIIRFQNKESKSRQPHTDLASTRITIPNGAHTARDILRLVRDALGVGWQVTVLPGYVIVYREHKHYPHAQNL